MLKYVVSWKVDVLCGLFLWRSAVSVKRQATREYNAKVSVTSKEGLFILICNVTWAMTNIKILQCFKTSFCVTQLTLYSRAKSLLLCKTDYPVMAHGIHLTVYHDNINWGLSINLSHDSGWLKNLTLYCHDTPWDWYHEPVLTGLFYKQISEYVGAELIFGPIELGLETGLSMAGSAVNGP